MSEFHIEEATWNKNRQKNGFALKKKKKHFTYFKKTNLHGSWKYSSEIIKK